MIKKRLNTQVKAVRVSSEDKRRDYALLGRRDVYMREKPDWDRDREKIKGMILPFVKEMIKKQMKEEREYYRSRPTMAAKQMEDTFGRGMLENILVPSVALRVYERLEDGIRREWVRKGR